jgi:hypothetical protein
MIIKSIVYDDEEIAVAIVQTKQGSKILHLAMKWLEPAPTRYKDGKIVPKTNLMGGETDWFVLPFTFAAAIGRVLIELKVTGLPYFNEDAFAEMVEWSAELEEVNSGMCY